MSSTNPHDSFLKQAKYKLKSLIVKIFLNFFGTYKKSTRRIYFLLILLSFFLNIVNILVGILSGAVLFL